MHLDYVENAATGYFKLAVSIFYVIELEKKPSRCTGYKLPKNHWWGEEDIWHVPKAIGGHIILHITF